MSSSVGRPLSSCGQAKAIQTYPTVAGTTETTYICRPPVADDRITDASLQALQARAAQLNDPGRATFADHETVRGIKVLIRLYTARQEGR